MTRTENAIRSDWLRRASFGGIFVFGIVMALLGAILPPLSERIDFDLAQAGNLFLAMNFCMLVSMLSLGPVMDRFGKKLALVGGSILVAVALFLIAGASSYYTLLAGVIFLGAGGGALNGASNVLIADLHTDPGEKSSALNLLGVFFGFGALFMPFAIGALLDSLGLTGILWMAVALSLLPGILFLVLAFPRPKQEQGFELAEAGRLFKNPLILLIGFLLFFQSGNEFIVGGYTSQYLTSEMGIAVSPASYILTAYWAAIMIGRIVSSRLLLRVNGSTVVLAGSLGAALSTVLLLLSSSPTVTVAAVVLLGLSFASIFPTTLGLAGSLFEKYSGTAFGILFAIALTGGMTLPWLVGQIADTYGLRTALNIVVGNSVMIFLLQLIILRVRRNRLK